MPDSSEEIPISMWRATLLIAAQSFLFGYCFSCLNSCLITGDSHDGSDCYHKEDSSCPPGTIYNDINLSTIEAQVATSLAILGAWIGCMIGNKPSELKGRKFTLMMNNVFFIVGAGLCSLGNVYTLFVGRFIAGIGVGISSVVPPVLLSEIATPATRGIITTMHQLSLTFGIFVVSMVGYGFVTYVDHGWQYVQATTVIPCILMLIFHQYIPESPKWLLSKQKINYGSQDFSANPMNKQVANSSTGGLSSEVYQEVYDTLKNLRPVGYSIDEEIKLILVEVKKDAALKQDISWSEVFSWHNAMIIGCGLMLFQAITGINSIVFYSTTIFELAGFSQSIIGTALFGIVNFFMTGVAAYCIDKAGRKILLLGGTYVMLFALVLLSAILLADVDDTIQGAIAVIAVLIYVGGFAIGFGAVSWTVMSEIMPTRLRMKAVSLFLSINWASNLVIGLVTLTAIDSLGGVKSDMDDDESANAQKRGVGALYLIFAAITAAAVVFLHIFVPETKGKNPEDLISANQPLLSEASDNAQHE